MSTSDKSEAFYKKLKIQLQDTTLWPSEYLYKFILTTNTTKIKKLSDLFDNQGAVITTKESKNGKYTSVSINLKMKNPDAVISKYKEVAEKIEDEFANRAKRKSRGVKQAPFYVISRVNMPSILIEAGFLTNPKEEDFLNTELGKDHIASAIFRGFRSYKESVDGSNISELDKSAVKEKEIIKIPTPKKEITTDKVVYKVQIGTYLKSMLSDKSFMNLNAYEEIINGTYKYYVGNAYNKVSADNVKIKMREKGFKGAFVVAFYQDKRICMQEALDLQTKNK